MKTLLITLYIITLGSYAMAATLNLAGFVAVSSFFVLQDGTSNFVLQDGTSKFQLN